MGEVLHRIEEARDALVRSSVVLEHDGLMGV